MEFEYIFRIIESLAACGIGVIAFFLRNQLNSIQKSIEQNSTDIQKQTEKINQRIDEVEEKSKKDVDAVREELNNLKADMPLIYTLREDFIRTLNNVETKMQGIESKIDRLLSK